MKAKRKRVKDLVGKRAYGGVARCHARRGEIRQAAAAGGRPPADLQPEEISHFPAVDLDGLPRAASADAPPRVAPEDPPARPSAQWRKIAAVGGALVVVGFVVGKALKNG